MNVVRNRSILEQSTQKLSSGIHSRFQGNLTINLRAIYIGVKTAKIIMVFPATLSDFFSYRSSSTENLVDNPAYFRFHKRHMASNIHRGKDFAWGLNTGRHRRRWRRSNKKHDTEWFHDNKTTVIIELFRICSMLNEAFGRRRRVSSHSYPPCSIREIFFIFVFCLFFLDKNSPSCVQNSQNVVNLIPSSH